jgi:hypothetical protein
MTNAEFLIPAAALSPSSFHSMQAGENMKRRADGRLT